MNWFRRKKRLDESLLKLKECNLHQWSKLKHIDFRLDEAFKLIKNQSGRDPYPIEMLPVNKYTMAESGSLPGSQVEIIAGRSAEELQDGLNRFLKRNPGMDVISTQLTAGPTALYAMVFYRTGLSMDSINS